MKPEDGHDKTIRGWIMSLSMPSIGISRNRGTVRKIDPALLVRDLCWKSPDDPLEVIKERYGRSQQRSLT